MQSLIATGSAMGGLGVGQSATRQIAAGRAGGTDAAPRRALFVATSVLAAIGALAIWASRYPLASLLLADPDSASTIGWMGLGVGLTIIAGSQTALLAGLGRVADVAKVSLLTALLSTVAAISFLLLFGERAVLPYLLAVPVASVLAGWLYAARADAPVGKPGASLSGEWRQLLGLGAAIMVSGMVMNLAQLAVRGLLSQRVGMAELGLYQAAAVISVTYLGFVLQAMSADFFPRLSALPSGSREADRLINEQTAIALLLGGPVILGMMGLAEWVLGLLYTSEFRPAAAVLRWQMLGDVLRLASWPLGFALLAAGRGRTFVLLELAAFGTFVSATWLLIPRFGIEAAGIGFLAMYILYLPMVMAAVRVRWSGEVWRYLLMLLACGTAILALAFWSRPAAAWAGLLLAFAGLALAYRRLGHALPFLARARPQ